MPIELIGYAVVVGLIAALAFYMDANRADDQDKGKGKGKDKTHRHA